MVRIPGPLSCVPRKEVVLRDGWGCFYALAFVGAIMIATVAILITFIRLTGGFHP